MKRYLVPLFLLLVMLPGCAHASQEPVSGAGRPSSAAYGRGLDPLVSLIDPELDLADHQPADLGPGAAYYLSRLHEREGDERESENLLRASWRTDPEPWRRAAVVRLMDTLLAAERTEETLAVAMIAVQEYPGDDEIALYLLEALYRSGRYRELFDRVARMEGGGRSVSREALGRWIPAADHALWRAVAAYELRTPDHYQLFARAFSDVSASDHHSRLFLFARARGDILERLGRSDLLLVEARYHLADGRTAQAARRFRELIDYRAANRMDMSDLVAPHTITDIGRAVTGGGDWRLSIAALDGLIPVAAEAGDTAALARLHEYRGRLYRSAGNRQAAMPAFAQSISMDGPGPNRDRVIWYAVQTSIDTSTDLAIRTLEQHGTSLSAPSRIAGLVDGLSSRLVQQRDWPAVSRLYRALDGFAGEGVIAQVAVTYAVALRSGLARSTGDAAAGDQADALLRRAASQWENPYYSLVASVLLGEEEPALHSAYPVDLSRWEDDEQLLAYVTGFFRFGLTDEGYRFARSVSPALSSHTLGRFAATLIAKQNYIDAMRLMDVVARREGRPPTAEQAALMYPRAFASEMATVIQAEALVPEIFYALVREESYFSPGIGSHVGAIGLSQLMPATAAEVARSMRISNPDLTDPLTNLSIGGRYLRTLINRFGSLHYALLGYNAGPTRIRRWSSERGSLPPVLFQESIPFAETRHYIRKIFVSAVQYGRIYGDVAPSQVFDTLFSLP